MKNNYDSLDASLNIESSIVEVKKETSNLDVIPPNSNDIKKDYEYTRANLYSLIEKGQEAINGIMELAAESDQPRAYEVAANMMKNLSDMTEKLMILQKQRKELEKDNPPAAPTNINVDKAVFVGSTSDLLKQLKNESSG